MNQSIRHRGPDASGEVIEKNYAAGHTRLSIIDLQGGAQPMYSNDRSLLITYNGELYNYKELRSLLIKKGHKFRTNSDTEVILYAYREWGRNCVEKFLGMFAFCILDTNKKELFLARDHLGIKPLYIVKNREYFAFASEIQAFKHIPGLKLTLDISALDEYLRLQYVSSPRTIFAEVEKIPPSTSVTVDLLKGRLKKREYWRLVMDEEKEPLDEATWAEEIDGAIHASVKRHLVSDVPFGVFLSGGVDSGIVLANMAKELGSGVRAFTVKFDNTSETELACAKRVAQQYSAELNVGNIKIDYLEALPKLVQHYGQPFGDTSAIPLFYLSKEARAHVPMVLSGDGGDEAFAGYNRYSTWLNWLTGRKQSGTRRLARSFLAQLLPTRYPPIQDSLENWLNFSTQIRKRDVLWSRELRKKVAIGLPTHVGEYERAMNYAPVKKGQYLDTKTYLPDDVLNKVDVASMAYGLEVRTPLVDKQVYELAARIPARYLLSDSASENTYKPKKLLKTVATRYLASDCIHREKVGFSIPKQTWEYGEYPILTFAREFLLDRNAHIRQFFAMDTVQSYISEKRYKHVWMLLFLEEWFKQNNNIIDGWS